jgi:hypothetical protein
MVGSKESIHCDDSRTLDLGHNYSYPPVPHRPTQRGEMIEEGMLRTIPEAFRRRFASEDPTRT